MKKEQLSRDVVLERMAVAFHDLLTALSSQLNNNKDIQAGIKEGLCKFLSNVHIAMVGKKHTDYYSEKAYDVCTKQNAKKTGLVYEHIVPKNRYQNEIITSFVDGNGMTEDEIRERLENSWWIATITKEEDDKLDRLDMPSDWDGKDTFARYRKAGITLHTWDEWTSIKSGGK